MPECEWIWPGVQVAGEDHEVRAGAREAHEVDDLKHLWEALRLVVVRSRHPETIVHVRL